MSVTDWLVEMTANRFAAHHHESGDNQPASMLINGEVFKILRERLIFIYFIFLRVQEPCESRGGRPGLPVLMSLMVSVDVKQIQLEFEHGRHSELMSCVKVKVAVPGSPS